MNNKRTAMCPNDAKSLPCKWPSCACPGQDLPPRAHSLSEYRRITAQGGDIRKPAFADDPSAASRPEEKP